MKFVRLIYRNLIRNKRRTLLTLSSIAASIFLVATLLATLDNLLNPLETPASALRLVTRHKVSIFNAIPISYRAKIEQVPGVDAVVGSMWFGGVYKEPSNFFAQFSVNTDQFFQVFPDIVIPEDQKEAFLKDRTGAIAGEQIANRFNWKIGQKITLKGALFRFDPELTLRGIYKGGPDDGNSFYFHWEYFNEGMHDANFTGTYTIRAHSKEQVPLIAAKVDELFRNAVIPTKTETEKAFLLGFVSMLGNVKFLITGICLVVIFTTILVAANTMAMAIRERSREIGILKALGFRSRQILLFLLSESVLLSLSGAILGALAAKVLFAALPMGTLSMGFLTHFTIGLPILLVCAGTGVVVGLISAGVPAWNVARQPVVAAMRRIT